MTGGEREVVKLSLGRGRPMLNVLPIGLEGDTLTLVCPFPVLPVELPVSVSLPGEDDQGLVAATIKRVGVELMGEAALPRFKLQLDLAGSTVEEASEEGPILVEDGQFEFEFGEEYEEPHDAEEDAAFDDEGDFDQTVEERESAPSEAEASPELEEADRGPRKGVLEIPQADMSWTAGEGFGIPIDGETTDKTPPLTWGEDGSAGVDEDPPWAAEHDTFKVRAALDDSSRRRSRWPIRTAIALILLVSAGALTYEMREQIAPMVSPFIGEELTLAALGMSPAPVVAMNDTAPLPEAADEESLSPSIAPTPIPIPEGEIDELVASTEPSESADEAAASLPDPSVDATDDQLRVILPTRWPVTEARSYRLNEPTGIVVDVPGGMASERARWIETAHERVRSVRVLEREDGVRFIIYLNDNTVPRYRVGYSRSGVTVDIMGPDPRHMASK